MFAVLTRPIARNVVNQSVRCMASKPKGPRREKMAQNPPANEPIAKNPPAADPLASKQQPLYEEPPVSEPAGETDVAPPPPLPTSSVPSLDFSPPELEEERQRTGARSSKDSLSSMDEQRRKMGRLTLAALTLALGLNVAYMGREWDSQELEEMKSRSEAATEGRWARTKHRYTEIFDYLNKPAWPELLPPQYPPPHGKPYTLLVSIDDLLVTSTWDRQHGWRTAKRPGVDYFLAYISQFYEVVIFTSQNDYTAIPVLDKLDRYNFFITHRLFRAATRSINGKIVKDLSYLNRDLSKVILLDTDPEHISTHPENAILAPKWKGDPKDDGLVALIPFLESIAIYKPQDVRPILTAYQGKNIPLEYGKKEAEGKQKHIEEWTSKNQKSGSANPFGSLFGLPARASSSVPLTYLEQKRKEAQLQYQEEQAYIKKNKDYLESLLEQDMKAMAAQVPGNLWEALDQFKGKPPAGPEGQAAEGSVVQVDGGAAAGKSTA